MKYPSNSPQKGTRKPRTGGGVVLMLLFAAVSTAGFVLLYGLVIVISQESPERTNPDLLLPDNFQFMIKLRERDSQRHQKQSSQTTAFSTIAAVSPEQLSRLPEPFVFLKTVLPQQQFQERILGSDIVDLSYCELSGVDWLNFTSWCHDVLEDKFQQLRSDAREHKGQFQQQTDNNNIRSEEWKRMYQEFVLQLLEVYANNKGFCNYNRFRPTVPTEVPSIEKEARLLQSVAPFSDPNHARLAIVIVAYKDAQHLARIVEALHMPHHYIILHMERRAPREFVQAVRSIANKYNNVAVLQFGTITYKTDTVTMVNLRIMRWLTEDLGLTYDYHLTMCGAVYPLYAAEEMAVHFKKFGRNVLLGELTDRGKRVNVPQRQFIVRKQVIYSIGTSKVKQRLAVSKTSQGFPEDTIIRPELAQAMSYKTVSGNTAAYSFETVQRLLSSSDAMELFAISKYSWYCCTEERNWIAALSLIGLREEALQYGSTWQVWGGKEKCEASMSNALLHTNASTCFRLEDASHGVLERNDTLYIRGNEIMTYLLDAKRRGFLFARKFSSDHTGSMTLMNEIRTRLHNNNTP